MAWVDIQGKGSKEIYKVTEEAYELVFKEQGYIIVSKEHNGGSTAQNKAVSTNTQPSAETPIKRHYTKRTRASND